MDYNKLGLRVGLEIHQQLDSGTKLFCNCPITRSEEFPLSTKRKLRAVPGELGDVDPAALQEYLKNKTFIYRSNPESSCLVELDEDPPKKANEKAVRIAIQVCKLLHCHVFPELHVMRKTVVDGSSVSGFQRTMQVGSNGYVEGSFGKIEISSVMLEEDASTPLSKANGIIEYRLDRQGIPLIELATSAGIKSPEMAKEVAEHIGLLLRSTSVVRGIGSIRQDINISIKDGARVEVKGFQELEKIPLVVENEVKRQIALLEIKDELKKRGFKTVKNDSKDVTALFSKTKSNFMKKIVDSNGFVYAMILPKFAGLLKKLCGDRTFGKELSAYAGVYDLGIMHSDEEVEKYSLGYEFTEMRRMLRAEPEDLVLITAGFEKRNIDNALEIIVERAKQCLNGVPEETRSADGIGSKYARPLPGSGRLYPESDIPPIMITKELQAVETPETLMDKRERLIKEFVKEHRMPESLARSIVTYGQLKGNELSEVHELIRMFPKIEAALIAKMIIEMPKEIRARFNLDASSITRQDYTDVLSSLDRGDIPQNAVMYILIEKLTGQSLDNAIEKYKILSDAELRKIIKNVVEKNKGKKESVLMGMIMSQIKGRAEGEKVAKLLREMASD